jgi:hypothetical protein
MTIETDVAEVSHSWALLALAGVRHDQRILSHEIIDGRLNWDGVMAESWSSNEERVLRIARDVYSGSGAALRDLTALPDDLFEPVISVLRRARASGVLGP